MAGGRPTKYDEEIVAKARAFYERFLNAPAMREQIIINAKGEQVVKILPNPDGYMPPYIEELSLLLDISDETINEWTKDKDKAEFSATIKKIKVLQKIRLMNLTLDKNSATGGIFQLKVNHGMIDTTRHELGGKVGIDLMGNDQAMTTLLKTYQALMELQSTDDSEEEPSDEAKE